MPRQVIDFSKTIIYKIVCNNLNVTDVYVGHTTNFVKRKYNHKSVCNNETHKKYKLKIYQKIRANGGWDNWSMLQICEFPCSSLQEARAEERKYYEILNANLNMVNPCRTMREYHDINKEQIIKQKKIWYEKNKKEILENKKEIYICCCGSTLTIDGKSQHKKTKKHIKFMESQSI